MVEIGGILHKRDGADGIADLQALFNGHNRFDFRIFRQRGVRVFKGVARRDGLESARNGLPCERVAAPCGFFKAQRLRQYN